MARELDPKETNRMDYPAGEPMNDPLIHKQRGRMTVLGLLAALMIAVMLGALLWNIGDATAPTASNTSSSVTTGSSTTPPPDPDPNKTDTR